MPTPHRGVLAGLPPGGVTQQPPLRVAVAASGGRDSTALLHCTVHAALPLGIQVVALHVHHGLSPQADAWLAHVRQQSRRWGASFASTRLAGAPAPGDSVEAWARRARYQALRQMALDACCSLVLLAHHRRDQAETWLLQALRSGGPAGLAAMPRLALRDGLTWARPWLDLPREAIEQHVRRHRLAYVDDDSNADSRFARNRLRLQVWPSLLAAFPAAETALAGAASHAAQAAALAAEIARHDLPAVVADGGLQMTAWWQLPPARRHNALQAWLRQQLPTQHGVPHSLLARLQDELPGRSSRSHGKSARWPLAGGELRLYRGALQWAAAPAPAVAMAAAVQASNHGADHAAVSGAGHGELLDLSQEGDIALPAWHGRIRTEAAAAGGVPAGVLRQVVVRSRGGGERFRNAPHAMARSLKQQFQTHAVPAWQRQVPLFFTADEQLLFVPGLGIDGALLAAPGTPQLVLRWLADAAGSAQSAHAASAR